MQAQIITIGDELLIGQVVDTNSAFMAEQLNSYGIELNEIVSVHDNAEQIISALEDALGRVDVVLLTGGLGPTNDDITKLTLCRFFSTRLVESEEVKKHISELYAHRPEVFNRLTATQWQVPENALILPNSVGSAPLMVWTIEKDGRKQWVCSMPGVPYEMEIAMREQILPYLSRQMGAQAHIVHRTVIVYGIPESKLALQIADWEKALPKTMHLAYLPKDGIVRLRLSAYSGVTDEEVDAQIQKLIPLLGDSVLATQDLPLEVLVGAELKRRGQTISTAESCTGGKLAVLLNRHAGSSEFYKGSVVAYANEVKENVLGVREQTLSEYGAVSEQTVREMAQGVKQLLQTDYAIATSGIAGPSGGTEQKPVGTVWIAVATPQKTEAQCFHFGKLRDKNTDRATLAALVKLLKILQSE